MLYYQWFYLIFCFPFFSECRHCKYILEKKLTALLVHSKQCTQVARPTESHNFVCYSCDYNAKTSDRMKNHIRIHIGEKPYKCMFCQYSCVQSSAMKIHLRTHSSYKPFKCSYCDYSCSQSNNLRNHIKSKKHRSVQ